MLAKFRKKPVVVEAVQFDGTFESVWPLLKMYGSRGVRWDTDDGGVLTVSTLEGDLKVNPGEWIIRGVKGELYPCKPDIFAQTYELAEG